MRTAIIWKALHQFCQQITTTTVLTVTKLTTSGTSRKSRNISNDQRLHELVKKMYMRVSVCNYIEQIILGKKQKRKLINIKMKNFSLLQL